MASWNSKNTARKGDVGEALIKEMLQKSGWIVYAHTGDMAHMIDFIAMKDGELRAIEVKTKARFNNSPVTGVDEKHWYTYKKVQKKHHMKVSLFFVDEHPKEERIYWNHIDNLNPSTYTTSGGVKLMLFPLSDMKEMRKLTKEEVEEIKKYNTRNYKYV